MTVNSNESGTDMSCDDVRDSLSAMKDGESYDADFNVIQRHLDICPNAKIILTPSQRLMSDCARSA